MIDEGLGRGTGHGLGREEEDPAMAFE